MDDPKNEDHEIDRAIRTLAKQAIKLQEAKCGDGIRFIDLDVIEDALAALTGLPNERIRKCIDDEIFSNSN